MDLYDKIVTAGCFIIGAAHKGWYGHLTCAITHPRPNVNWHHKAGLKSEVDIYIPDRVAQSVICLTADPGVVSLMSARSYTFVEIDHEIISTAILLPSAVSRKVVVSCKRKHVHEVLVNCLEACPGKSVVRWTDCPDMTIAVDCDVKHQTKQKKLI